MDLRQTISNGLIYTKKIDRLSKKTERYSKEDGWFLNAFIFVIFIIFYAAGMLFSDGSWFISFIIAFFGTGIIYLPFGKKKESKLNDLKKQIAILDKECEIATGFAYDHRTTDALNRFGYYLDHSIAQTYEECAKLYFQESTANMVADASYAAADASYAAANASYAAASSMDEASSQVSNLSSKMKS